MTMIRRIIIGKPTSIGMISPCGFPVLLHFDNAIHRPKFVHGATRAMNLFVCTSRLTTPLTVYHELVLIASGSKR
jgi:hypothetical protein